MTAKLLLTVKETSRIRRLCRLPASTTFLTIALTGASIGKFYQWFVYMWGAPERSDFSSL